MAPNRIVNQPMECNDADDSGSPTELTLRRYRRLAEGGAGVIFVESLTISYESRARKNQLKISEDTADGLANLVREMRRINRESLILFQINHSGRLSHGTFSKVVSVYPTGDPGIHLLEREEIEEIAGDFVKAAVIAREVGADGIDFKHCHGYFGAEMVRPANTRQDSYGGTFENRTRFFRETVARMKKALGDGSFIMGTRYSVYEGIPGGFGTEGPQEVIEDLAEPVAFARVIEESGMDYINVSAGIPSLTPEIVRPTKKYPPGVYRHFGWARAIKHAVRIPVIGSGYSYLRDGRNDLAEPDPAKKDFLYWAEKNLCQGHVDLVGIGRQSLADPLFAKKILSGKTDSIDFCRTCGGCSVLLRAQKPVGCTIYDRYYREVLRQVRKEAKG
ncbi:MAG: 2,4-dienoyl-CoA reductase [Deltaproteobacteria bacterium]|nr:2,4-dienoyl-CoA reductase [Deltaproteobacteria bacterium]MBW2121386.1 2,4-dienoyl-CoA reductase [Deltaproteobacteria bacterium]